MRRLVLPDFAPLAKNQKSRKSLIFRTFSRFAFRFRDPPGVGESYALH